MRWVLIGFSCSGKTRLGHQLANEKGWPFFDTDIIMEREFLLPIFEIFQKIGEEKFREKETQIVEGLSQHNAPSAIFATGGGIVEKEENLFLLKKLGKILFLDEKPDILYQRIRMKKASRFQKFSFEEFLAFYELRKQKYFLWAESKVSPENFRSFFDE